MNRTVRMAGVATALAVCFGATIARAQEPASPKADPARGEPTRAELDELLSRMRAAGAQGRTSAPANDHRYPDFNELTRGAEKVDGLFTLYRKEDHLYAEVRPHQLDQPMLVLATIARGLGRTGEPVSNGDEMVVVFRRVNEHIQLVRRNIYYKATPGTPIEKSVKQNYVDSVLMSMPIRTISPSGSPVIDLADMFMTDLAQLNIGFLDRGRSSWYKVKGLKDNLELEVEATFGGGMRGMLAAGDGVADPRGITLVIHYSLIRLPSDFGFRTRLADDRIGHWLSTSKDFGSADTDSNYVRLINRWRLDKADMRSKLSPPKKQVVWWVEDTVPHEYRPYVEAGILEWNKAFEKIGFRNALAVRWQQPGEEFDPEDTSYCTFRWVTSDRGYARTCFRANPLTGEIIDGDVIFDSSFIRHWKQEYALMIGARPAAQGGEAELAPLALGEVISPILASKYGFGALPLHAGRGDGANGPAVVPADWSALDYRLGRLARRDGHTCTYQAGMQADFALAAMALATPDRGGKGGPVEVPEDFIGQALKEIVMHEVGHSIGLRHNFKASTMLTAEQLNDPAITRVKGLVGSVMDYSPVNIAPKGVKQGDYYTTTLGPYDYWAIEYAYKPIMGDEAGELRAIAARAPEPDLAFATDEDSFLNNDPQVNRFDLGSDVCRFAKDRLALAGELLKDLDAKVVRDGEPWSRNRRAFAILIAQYGNAAHLVSNYIGGQSISRDHKGDKNARDPIVPVPGPKQRECLMFLVDQILSDRAFKFSPALLRRLATEKWSGWGNEALMLGEVDYPVHERVLDVQRIVLAQCLAPDVLARLENQELQAEPGSKPLKMAEVFRALTDGIWAEVNPDAACDCCEADAGAQAAPKEVAFSTVRRNLQRDYLRRLGTIVLGERRSDLGAAFAFVSFNGGGSYPADARALARLHLRQLGDRIAALLARKDVAIDDTTRAHLEDCRHKVGKVLEAGLDANEP